MTDISTIRLYATNEHPCSYLKQQLATTLFVDPNLALNRTLYSELSDYGFRRSGKHIYRPNCRQCQACIAVRIAVEDFKPNRAQKRCYKQNYDLNITEVASINTTEHYQLYAHYIQQRHADGDMFPPSLEQYQDFLSAEFNATRYLEMRENGRLIAVAVCDALEQGLSAIYTFFDPNETQRGLGVFAVLYQIQKAREMKLPFLYLGYWIQDCEKMRYKSQYRPMQMLVNGQWTTLD